MKKRTLPSATTLAAAFLCLIPPVCAAAEIEAFVQDFEHESVGARQVEGFNNSGSEAPYAAQVVAAADGHPVRYGKQAYRFETRFTGDARPIDPCYRLRSELSETHLVGWNETTWYGYSLYIPSDQGTTEVIPGQHVYVCDGEKLEKINFYMVGQFHRKKEQECDGHGNPWLKADVGTHTQQWSARTTAEVCSPSGDRIENFDSPAYSFPKDTWVDITIKLIADWRPDGEGEVKVWVDTGSGKRLVADYLGPIAYNDPNAGYIKIGMYGVQPEQSAHKVVYLDEFRRGPTRDSVALPE